MQYKGIHLVIRHDGPFAAYFYPVCIVTTKPISMNYFWIND